MKDLPKKPLPFPASSSEIQHKEIITRLDSILASISERPNTVDKNNLNYCPPCNRISEFRPFGIISRKKAKCPNCRSLERGRALWLYLQRNTKILEENSSASLKVLHFAPEKFFYDKFTKNQYVDYYPVDFNPNFKGIRDVVDIQKIPYEDGMFDIIICIHVLEHIADDYTAMTELLRVLKTDGTAYILVPLFNELTVTYEDPSHSTPELRLKHYGQSDHLRKYGTDFIQRLMGAGFNVTAIKTAEYFSESEMDICSLQSDFIFECTNKTSSTPSLVEK
jgi:SAM-dependent methyltransferase